MSTPAGAEAGAFDAFVDLDLDAFHAERERRYRVRLADEADAACAAIERQIEGMRQTLASKRAEAEEYRRPVAVEGGVPDGMVG